MQIYRFISKAAQYPVVRDSDPQWLRVATNDAGVIFRYVGRQQAFPRNEHGHLVDRCGEVVVDDGAVIIGNTSHAMLRQAYLDWRDQQTVATTGQGLPAQDAIRIKESMVDLELRRDVIYLRPIAGNPTLTFNADNLLQTVESKWKIKFTYLSEKEVRKSIIRRGELWRISVPTQTYDEMKQWVQENRFPFEGSAACFYKCITTGTRYLTYENFARLETLSPQDLARLLNHIMTMAREKNEHYNLEIDLFMADASFDLLNQPPVDYVALLESDGPEALFDAYRTLLDGFFNSVDRRFLSDDINNEEWTREMFL